VDRVAVHPLVAPFVVVVGEGEVGSAVAQGLAHGDAFLVEGVGDGADGRLGAFVVDVPVLEVLDRPDGRWKVPLSWTYLTSPRSSALSVTRTSMSSRMGW